MQKQIRIALPSKGRMERETSAFLSDCGLKVYKPNPRQYLATIPALPGVQVLFQRAHDIPVRVEAGDVDLGITGYDALVEKTNGDQSVVVIHEAMGYGKCSLVLAVPEDWQDVRSVSDLAKKSQTQSLRIATGYKQATEQFLRSTGIKQTRMVSADGALELAPTIGYADCIADLVSTGTTLRENRLRQIEGGTILDSQAILIGNRQALETRPELLAATRQLLEFIEAHLRARGQYHVFVNMRGGSIKEVAQRIFEHPNLSGLQGPTISPMTTRDDPGDWWAINLIVSAPSLYETIQQIRAIGGSGVVVTPVTYIFEEQPERYQRLLQTLK
jgi:ATP phosphoribosyltransferase